MMSFPARPPPPPPPGSGCGGWGCLLLLRPLPQTPPPSHVFPASAVLASSVASVPLLGYQQDGISITLQERNHQKQKVMYRKGLSKL